MLSDVTVVAIIGASSTVLVALAASIGQVFGPTWLETRRRKAERLAASEDARFEKAEALVRSLLEYRRWTDEPNLSMRVLARTAFVATLRKGEGVVADFVTRDLNQIDKIDTSKREPVDQFADSIFGYLRGDLSLGDIAGLRRETVISPPPNA
jgi:hypothetical protein